MEIKKLVNRKFLRYGYTTGSCATAAAKAATIALLTKEKVPSVEILTADGTPLTLEPIDFSFDAKSASCAVEKDSGDDPDITNGILVYAEVSRIDEGIIIVGGEGVGKVTKAGLDQPIGAAAINSDPRKMITDEIQKVCHDAGYFGGISATISIPKGAEIAKKTFNPNLGIEGGLSVLGTTGIVEPMSNSALIDTIKLELSVLHESGYSNLLLTIGNFGEIFAVNTLKIKAKNQIKCSNFIGETISSAVELGFKQIFLVGHVGKLVKLGIGVTNTHSANGDGRVETLVACALEAGASLELLREAYSCVTTEAIVELLRSNDLLAPTMRVLEKRIQATLEKKVPENIKIGFVCFIGTEILMQSENAKEMVELW